MKKSKILDHLFTFCLDHRLLTKGVAVVVSVSGGVDSMTLLWVCSEWLKLGLISSLRAIHFNHGTRQENSKEQQMVEEYCQTLGIACYSFALNMPFKSNFEAEARLARHDRYKQFVNPGERLLQAHHLDDSFEWSLMARFRSGALKSSLGIPARNGFISRPFMCLSKKQIIGIAKRFAIPYLIDSSNDNTHFERNYLRKVVIPLIATRFPRYLKYYVTQSNILARKMRCHLRPASQPLTKIDVIGGIWVYQSDFSTNLQGSEEAMEEAITKLSSTSRGVLRKQIERGISAANKQNPGPLHFSGGVLGYFYPGAAYFLPQAKLIALNAYDQLLKEKLEKSLDSQIPNIDITQFSAILKRRIGDKESAFPHLIIATGQNHPKHWPSLKKVDPLLPKTSSYLIEKGLYFRFALHFLSLWKRRSRFCFAIRDI